MMYSKLEQVTRHLSEKELAEALDWQGDVMNYSIPLQLIQITK